MFVLIVDNVVVQTQPNAQKGFIETNKNPICGQIEKDGLFSDPVPTAKEVADRAQRRLNEDSLSYLNQTDWYVTRRSESGEEVPQNVLDARAKARTDIKEV